MHRRSQMSYSQIAQHPGLGVSAIEKHMAGALATLAKANHQE